MGMGGRPPVLWERENFPPIRWNLKKQEEPMRYEVHSLWERYDQLKVELSQQFSQPMVC